MGAGAGDAPLLSPLSFAFGDEPPLLLLHDFSLEDFFLLLLLLLLLLVLSLSLLQQWLSW